MLGGNLCADKHHLISDADKHMLSFMHAPLTLLGVMHVYFKKMGFCLLTAKLIPCQKTQKSEKDPACFFILDTVTVSMYDSLAVL